MSVAVSQSEFGDIAPLWRDAVVGASVAAMAAAAGLAAYHEAGAAPWLSIAVGGVTAVTLWAAHRKIGGATRAQERRKPARRQPIAAPIASDAGRPAAPAAPVMAAPKVAAKAAHMSALPPVGPAAVVPVTTLDTSPLPYLQAAPNEPRVELSAFAPRQANVVPEPERTPSSERKAAPSTIDPEAQFLHLQGLVRQLAADVAGPRALSPDPDRGIVPAHEQAPMQVGFAPAPEAVRESAKTVTPVTRLAEAVAAERFDVLLEPIQKLSEARARHFEISVRFRDSHGDALEPDEVKRISRHNGLATSIDALKLPRVAKIVQRVQSRGGAPADVLTALAGASLADHAFMESLVAAFPVGVPGPLVLSFPQADVRAFARIHWSALTALADMGLRFALEDVSDLDMDFELLRARQFVFAKLDAAIFLGGLPCAGDIVPSADICRHLETAGLDLVVSGIDDEAQLGRIAAHAVPYGQGKLYGGARPVKAEILR